MEKFMRLFRFDPTRVGYVGVERECFLQEMGYFGRGGKILPQAPQVLHTLDTNGVPYTRVAGNYWSGTPQEVTTFEPARPGEFGYELSACQLESRIGPCLLSDLPTALGVTQARLNTLLETHHLRALYTEVGPEDMPLEVYPDPSGRYERITQGMPREILLAACRVIGTHVHIGMRDHDMALRVYNRAVECYYDLCMRGNGSFGERLAIYRTMAPDAEPKPYATWEDYFKVAQERGFVEDPRKCWTLIRISVHGTIEFRMFGATADTRRVVEWASMCHRLCVEAM